MYYMYLNIPDQTIIIENDGVLVASRALPTQQIPNPGKDALMSLPGNQEAYDEIHDLVADANDGCEMEG